MVSAASPNALRVPTTMMSLSPPSLVVSTCGDGSAGVVCAIAGITPSISAISEAPDHRPLAYDFVIDPSPLQLPLITEARCRYRRTADRG
ncbi:hypothetical protein [Sphingomonas panacisoli]|uniref:hypothetical protein n=1 Tax=Sphingomonas panacisoli TaxID=1813879 RepID=UPI001960D089|nr:hypothetical protein [Sphingomonas panacisoli]